MMIESTRIILSDDVDGCVALPSRELFTVRFP